MPRVDLTDRFCSSVRSDRRENYFDTKVRGLVLRGTPTGTRTWWFVYHSPKEARRHDDQPRPTAAQWLALGAYGTGETALTLARARAVAQGFRTQVDVEKRDPADEARAAKAAAKLPPPPPPAAPPKVFTFADMADLYVRLARAKKRTWRDDVVKIDKYLRPAWGERPLADITRAEIHDLLDTLMAAGLTTGVNRVQSLITRIFSVALDRSKVDAHPAAKMEKRFAETPGDRTLTDDEIRALWAGLDAHPGPAADAIRLRLLTGQRGGEVVGMQWSEIDLDARLWSLPGTRTKNKKPHAVPLSDQVVAILERRRAEVAKDEPAVFPGLTLQSDAHRALAALHAGTYEWTDLRRTVATRLGELGFDDTVIGRCLNHAAATVTAKHYNKYLYLPEKTAGLTAWDRELDRILRKGAKPSKVLAHRPKGRR